MQNKTKIKNKFIAAHLDYAENLHNKNTTVSTCTFCNIAKKRFDLKTFILPRGINSYNHCGYCPMNSSEGNCYDMFTYVASSSCLTKINKKIIRRKLFHKKTAAKLKTFPAKAFIDSMPEIGEAILQIDKAVYKNFK